MRSLAASGSSVLFAAGVLGGIPVLVTVSGFAGTVVTLGYLWALWDEQNQTLHDKIAGSVVVHG